ncbi:MAG: class I SAM-dependent methyltransferase [Xanthomonadaceae bacterium]|nr:class I SAM-dependent methyltransferase [Xanthomonadaceae bacterium]
MQSTPWTNTLRQPFRDRALQSNLGIPVLMDRAHDQENRVAIFEGDYTKQSEPWNYSHRAIEGLRHDWVIEQLELTGLMPGQRVLELGCSLGLMTEKLQKTGAEIFAMDLSATAVAKARARVGNAVHFLVADASVLPFEDGLFERVLVCDGLFGWHLDEATQAKVASEVLRVLKPGGTALFTDYIHHHAFYKVRNFVRDAGFKISGESFLGDRLWYQFASAFKAIESWKIVQKILSNRKIAIVLQKLARMVGAPGTRHIMVMGKK